MPDLHLVVLAAGKGTRMKSRLPKVLHEVGGLPLIEHVLRTADAIAPSTTVIVIGHEAAAITERLSKRLGLLFALQDPQLGTGHALLQTEPLLKDRSGTVVLLSGDVPLLRSATLRTLVDHHRRTRAAATVVTAVMEDPAGYGRIVRANGSISAIVEHKDASPAEREISEINSGIYAFDLPPLFGALRKI
jgi:UDP-N-acetylglucosamine diphosphorylase/glucosamine-1-phosphate N-acetyltransferase